jgi:V-type H+-transporting ATPase subunit a
VFEKILFRALRGNLFMNHAEIQESIIDPATDALVAKNVFIVFAHGKELLARIRKIGESIGATMYQVDEHPDKRRDEAMQVMTRIEDLKHVLDNTRQTLKEELAKVSEDLKPWQVMITKEISIYHTMNQMSYDLNRKALIAEGWVPKSGVSALQQCLRLVTERTGSAIPPILSELGTHRTPPTAQDTNSFTSGFQAIVDAYGTAQYGEVNPALFSIITFPFLFAVMFGDFGHGLIITILGTWTVWNQKTLAKKDWGENWTIFFGGRYIILLMGIFSMFTGLIYNDIFSQSMTILGSSKYTFKEETPGLWIGDKTETYAFGVDPSWHGSENLLLFSNSYKMKMSVIMGVIHMSFGMAIQAYNHIHYKKKINIYLEVVPQLLFFWSIFGYLVVLIVMKWLIQYDNPSEAPGLLDTLIYMFLSPGTVKMQMFPGQGFIQVVLLLLALVAVPWMLLAKPYHEKWEHERITGQGYANPHNAQRGSTLSEEGLVEVEIGRGSHVSLQPEEPHEEVI